MKTFIFAMLASFLLNACSDQRGSASSSAPVSAPSTNTPSPAASTPLAPQTKAPQILDPDFRSIKWGMSRAQLEAVEGSPASTMKDGSLAYNAEVAGMSASLFYQFANDQVARGAYVFTTKHQNPNECVDDFHALNDLLIQKYGKPIKTHEIWSDDLYKDNPQEWGMAVISGRLQLASDWVTPTTKIELWLRGDNFEPTMTLRYQSVKLGSALEKRNESENLKDL